MQRHQPNSAVARSILLFAFGVWILAGSTANAETTIRELSGSAATPFPAAIPAGTDPNSTLGRQLPIAMGADVTSGTPSNSQTQSASNPRIRRSLSLEQNLLGVGPAKTLSPPHVQATAVVGSNPLLRLSFDGINGVGQRLANGGNQFDNEPPDQGLCAGNGYVMEAINVALRVYDSSGNPLTGVTDLNTFFGYPDNYNRTTGLQGPFLSDPSCYFDADTQRWFVSILTFDVDPASGNFLGPNRIDIAVSATSNPTGNWAIYHLPVQDDGTDGTPNHGCSLGPCYGDYPHIGADKYGFYVTTNEYSLFGTEFKSAQIYAFSKAALASNAPVVTVVQFDTTGAVQSSHGVQPGFTIIPAVAPNAQHVAASNGTELFMSSNASQEATGIAGGSFSNELIVWALSNTESLNTNAPTPVLRSTVIRSEVYGIPPWANQKIGDVPQAECLNIDCLGFGPPPNPQVEGPLDPSDTRMFQVWFVNGSLWGALDTVVAVDGQNKAGVAYFNLNVGVDFKGHPNASIENQGYLAVSNNNVIYPAIAVLPSGSGVMAFTLVGEDFYPSAAYALINSNGTNSVHIAGLGIGPQDGFSEYAFGGGRPRWGDYGAAVSDGSNIWFANEYIAQTCTFATYMADMTCGGTRDKYVNWATRISKIRLE